MVIDRLRAARAAQASSTDGRHLAPVPRASLHRINGNSGHQNLLPSLDHASGRSSCDRRFLVVGFPSLCLTLSRLQPRVEDEPLKIEVLCPQNGTAVLNERSSPQEGFYEECPPGRASIRGNKCFECCTVIAYSTA